MPKIAFVESTFIRFRNDDEIPELSGVQKTRNFSAKESKQTKIVSLARPRQSSLQTHPLPLSMLPFRSRRSHAPPPLLPILLVLSCLAIITMADDVLFSPFQPSVLPKKVVNLVSVCLCRMIQIQMDCFLRCIQYSTLTARIPRLHQALSRLRFTPFSSRLP